MRQAQIEFLRNALRGDDFSDEVIAGLLQALNELENLNESGMDRPENSHDTPKVDQSRKTKRCPNTIEFGDDYGDNAYTFRCQLFKGHRGKHQEQGQMDGLGLFQPYILTWENIPVDQQATAKQEPAYA